MKVKLLFLALGFSLFSATSYANLQNIKDVKKMPDKQNVTFSGKVVKMVGDDDFIIKDATGEIQVEIDLLSEEEKITFFKKYPALVGATVVVSGILDNEILETTKVDVKYIRVDSSPSEDPFIMATEGNLSKVTSIQTARSLNNKDHVLLYGTVTQVSGHDDFILRDNSGDSIKIDLDFRTKGEEIEFTSNYFPNLVGSTIVIEGFLDKEFGDTTKIDAVRVKVLTKGSNDPFSGIPNQSGR